MQDLIIDPHVHLRGNEYKDINFLEIAIRDCQLCGIQAVMEMPNPKPWLTTPQALADRHTLAREAIDRSGYEMYHWMHIGLTTSLHQVAKAVRIAKEQPNYCRGIKIFWTHSTGDMGLLDRDYQKKVWKVLANLHYTGPVLQHLEDEDEWLVPYTYTDPVTHSCRQNPESEYIQVERQLRNAHDAGFRGTFYICHVSNPATIKLARDFEAEYGSFPIIIEMTWHHMFLNIEDYKTQGNLVKMNPPLRSPRMQEMLLEAVLAGDVDIIASDHAPHPLAAKKGATPSSGIPALPFWPRGIEKLRALGIEEMILESLISRKAREIFKLDFPIQQTAYQYNPELWSAYGWNPFLRVQ